MPFSWFGQGIPIERLPMLGFLIPGPKEIILVALVALALYGRGGSRLLMSTRYGRMLSPWVRMAETARPKRGSSGRTNEPGLASKPEPPTTRPKGRFFWALALMAAAAVAAWVATRVVIQHAASLPPP